MKAIAAVERACPKDGVGQHRADTSAEDDGGRGRLYAETSRDGQLVLALPPPPPPPPPPASQLGTHAPFDAPPEPAPSSSVRHPGKGHQGDRHGPVRAACGVHIDRDSRQRSPRRHHLINDPAAVDGCYLSPVLAASLAEQPHRSNLSATTGDRCLGLGLLDAQQQHRKSVERHHARRISLPTALLRLGVDDVDQKQLSTLHRRRSLPRLSLHRQLLFADAQPLQHKNAFPSTPLDLSSFTFPHPPPLPPRQPSISVPGPTVAERSSAIVIRPIPHRPLPVRSQASSSTSSSTSASPGSPALSRPNLPPPLDLDSVAAYHFIPGVIIQVDDGPDADELGLIGNKLDDLRHEQRLRLDPRPQPGWPSLVSPVRAGEDDSPALFFDALTSPIAAYTPVAVRIPRGHVGDPSPDGKSCLLSSFDPVTPRKRLLDHVEEAEEAVPLTPTPTLLSRSMQRQHASSEPSTDMSVQQNAATMAPVSTSEPVPPSLLRTASGRNESPAVGLSPIRAVQSPTRSDAQALSGQAADVQASLLMSTSSKASGFDGKLDPTGAEFRPGNWIAPEQWIGCSNQQHEHQQPNVSVTAASPTRPHGPLATSTMASSYPQTASGAVPITSSNVSNGGGSYHHSYPHATLVPDASSVRQLPPAPMLSPGLSSPCFVHSHLDKGISLADFVRHQERVKEMERRRELREKEKERKRRRRRYRNGGELQAKHRKSRTVAKEGGDEDGESTEADLSSTPPKHHLAPQSVPLHDCEENPPPPGPSSSSSTKSLEISPDELPTPPLPGLRQGEKIGGQFHGFKSEASPIAESTSNTVKSGVPTTGGAQAGTGKAERSAEKSEHARPKLNGRRLETSSAEEGSSETEASDSSSVSDEEKDEDEDERVRSLTRQLAETAVGVREMRKQLGRARVKSVIQSVLIITKARDNKLIKLTRELALWLMLTPRNGKNTGIVVYVDSQLRTSKRFDAESIRREYPQLFAPVSRRSPSLSSSASSLVNEADNDQVGHDGSAKKCGPSSWSRSGSGSSGSGKEREDQGQLRYWTPEMCSKSPHLFDFVVTLGGDGTVLFCSWLFQRIVPPVLPFALGSLGFLTNFNFDQYPQVMNNALEDGIRVNLRMRFSCTVYRAQPAGDEAHRRRAIRSGQTGEILMRNLKTRGWEALENPPGVCEGRRDASMTRDGGEAGRKDKEIMCFITRPVETFEVLNDLVVDRGPSPYVSLLELFGDEHHLTTVQADGLVLATPTGSTAYSLSAGGSLVHPEIPAILITPICPHTLSFRPMLLPDSMELRICVPYNSRSTAWASFDGRGRIELKQGDHIKVTASKFPFPTVCADKQSTDWFHAIARTLKWNERQRQKSFVVVEDDGKSGSGASGVPGDQATAHEKHVADDVKWQAESTFGKVPTGGDTEEEDEEEEQFDIDDTSAAVSAVGSPRLLPSSPAELHERERSQQRRSTASGRSSRASGSQRRHRDRAEEDQSTVPSRADSFDSTMLLESQPQDRFRDPMPHAKRVSARHRSDSLQNRELEENWWKNGRQYQQQQQQAQQQQQQQQPHARLWSSTQLEPLSRIRDGDGEPQHQERTGRASLTSANALPSLQQQQEENRTQENAPGISSPSAGSTSQGPTDYASGRRRGGTGSGPTGTSSEIDSNTVSASATAAAAAAAAQDAPASSGATEPKALVVWGEDETDQDDSESTT